MLLEDKTNTMTGLEKIVFSLRELYSSYGYSQYSMSKFEEYDFYSRNKEFLVSDGVITFTDTNGKLMALKPDVTLSIVKNDNDSSSSTRKFYYDENVYRVSKGNGSFREIKQAGLECIGAVDPYQLAEVALLAAKTLQSISDDFVLVVSDLDILLAFVNNVCSDERVKDMLIKCVGEKNAHGLDEIAETNSLDPVKVESLKELISLYGSPNDVFEKLKELSGSLGLCDEISKLYETVSVFEGSSFETKVQIDFSIVSDLNYYNGIVFKGYISDVPDSVLSGGQYDRLMDKLFRRSRAVGFAVYLDLLDRLETPSPESDVDIILLYSPGTPVNKIHDAVDAYIRKGKRVTAIPENSRLEPTCGEVVRI